MEIQYLGLSAQQLFVLIFLGLGPIRIVLAWMNIAPGLSGQEQRQVAWRITWVSMVMVLGIMFLGFFTVRNITPQRELLGIGVAIVVIVSSLVQRTPQPVASDEPPFRKAMRMAIYPLAVPTMINPAGLGILIVVATFVEDVPRYMAFFGTVVVVFFINFGLMLVVGRTHRTISSGVTLLLGEVFAILLVSLGVYIILRNLALLGVITLAGT